MGSTSKLLSTGVVLILQILWYSNFIPKVSTQYFNNRRVYCESDAVSPPDANHTATIFFLHGLHEFGVSAKIYLEMVHPLFPFKHIKMIYPNAPLSYYAPLIGYERFTWFDELGRGPQYTEITEDGYQLSMDGLTNLILAEIQHNNLTEDRVIIGGFDQGGAMAMHIAYRHFRDAAGIFAFNSYLSDDSLVYKELSHYKAEKLPPLYYVAGAQDKIIKPEWAESTFNRLQKLGAPGQFRINKDLGHELRKDELVELRKWIVQRLGTS